MDTFIIHKTEEKHGIASSPKMGRHLFALDFVNEKIGYASGERGFLLKTIDGGKNWKTLSTTGTLNWLYGMAFKDKDNGFRGRD
jgi:photosystem II stability/assembly factor-like uncharacterized protein